VVFAASFVDWLSAVATAAAVVIALFVALFVPRWHEKQREPKIDLQPDPRGRQSSSSWSTADLLRLRIHNAPGRRTAEQVEVFASVVSRSPGDGDLWVRVHLEDKALNFDEPGGVPPGRSTTSVPSGFSRPVSFVLIGPPTSISERYGVEVKPDAVGELPDWVAVPALYPAVRESATWFTRGKPLEVTLVVTGANFDAVTFRGEFEMSEEVDDRGEPSVLSGWTELPTERREATTSEAGPFR
jgi:hypothetical protein